MIDTCKNGVLFLIEERGSSRPGEVKVEGEDFRILAEDLVTFRGGDEDPLAGVDRLAYAFCNDLQRALLKQPAGGVGIHGRAIAGGMPDGTLVGPEQVIAEAGPVPETHGAVAIRRGRW